MAKSVVWNDKQLRANLRKVDVNVRRAMIGAVRFNAPQAEAYMKNTATWTDRTGNARNGLSAVPIGGGNRVSLVLFHAVPYGIWLEVRFSGRYAVIGQTVDKFGPQVMATFGKLLNWR